MKLGIACFGVTQADTAKSRRERRSCRASSPVRVLHFYEALIIEGFLVDEADEQDWVGTGALEG